MNSKMLQESYLEHLKYTKTIRRSRLRPDPTRRAYSAPYPDPLADGKGAREEPNPRFGPLGLANHVP